MFKTDLGYISLDTAIEFIKQNEANKPRLLKLKDYYLGDHEILHREMNDPSKPNNKIISNLPAFAVDIRTGYFSGEPLTITSDDKEQTFIMNDILEYNDFQDINGDLDEISSIYGAANLALWLDEDGEIRMTALNPLESFVIYDNTLKCEPVGAVIYHYYTKDNVEMINMTVYNLDAIRYFNGKADAPDLTHEEINFFGGVPMVEYVENKYRKGSFEDAISLVDAIEAIQSSSVNEIEYFDNAYLHLKNLSATDMEDIQNMKNNRVLLTDGDGDVSFITKQVNDAYIQNMLDRLTKDFHKLTATPNLTDDNFAGNASGVAMEYKLFGLEKQMNKKESKWRKSLQATIELIVNVLNLRGFSIDYRTYKIVFTRALPQNTSEIVEMTTKLNGLVSTETLLSQLPFVEKPQEEIERLNAEKQANFDMYSFPSLEVPVEGQEEV